VSIALASSFLGAEDIHLCPSIRRCCLISEMVPFPGCEAERLDATGQDQIGRE